MIRPVKVEVVYPDPSIYVLRDLLSDSEMERLKELAAPKVSLKKKSAWNGQGGKEKLLCKIVCLHAWLVYFSASEGYG